MELWKLGLKKREQELYEQLIRFPELPVVKWYGKVAELKRVLTALNDGKGRKIDPKEAA